MNRQNLIEALQAIKPGLTQKDIIELGNCFMFTGDKITTYNDRISISYDFKSGLEGSIPAEEFYKILLDIPEESIELEIADGKLQLQSKNIKAELSIFDNNEEILETINDIGKWKRLPEDFIEGISLCVFSASKDMTKMYLTCLDVRGDKISSSDNLRISQYQMKSEIKDDFLLPASSAVELIKLGGFTHYTIGDSWVHFKNGDGLIFCSRIVNETFPDVSEFFGLKGPRFKFPKDVKQIIKTSSILAEGQFDVDKKIEVEISDGVIKCKGQQSIGWVESRTVIDFKKDKIKFGINPEFFIRILDKAITAVYDGDKILFRYKSFKHLMALFMEEDE